MIKKLADRLLKWFCHPAYYDEIHGDMEELYQRNMAKNIRFSQWKYLFQIISLFRPSLLRPLFTNFPFNPMMLLNYFKISSRILIRQKLYSTINILGLAVGMGVSLLIYQYINFELSYDKFHAEVENIYRLNQSIYRNGENHGKKVFTTYGLGPAGKASVPGIVDFVRIKSSDVDPAIMNTENNKIFLEKKLWYVEDNFLKTFDFPLIYGDIETALNDKSSIVITEKVAQKYFGDKPPLGKILNISAGVLSGDFTVTGVLYDLPVNSHLQFNFLIPINFILETHDFYSVSDSEGWGLADFATYIKLNPSANKSTIIDQLDRLVAKKAIGDTEDINATWKIGMDNITDIHLKSTIPNDIATNNGSIQNIRFFGIIAVFILVIAWINYINLSTAFASNRYKEIAIRKAIGAKNRQLRSQFLFESVILNVVAGTLAVLIAYLLLPSLSTLVGKSIELDSLQNLNFWAYFTVTILMGAIISGIYPAFILSSYKSTSTFKKVNARNSKYFGLRRSLILFQFLLSIMLISGTYLVYKQIKFMQNKDLGIDMEKILIVKGPRNLDFENLTKQYSTFKKELSRHHSIVNASAMSQVPGKGYFYTEGFRKFGEPSNTDKEASYVMVDTDFSDTYNLEFLAKVDYPKDVPDNEKVIINEKAVKTLGLGSPQEALNIILLNNWGDSTEVVGVVKDFHWNSLKVDNSPVLFILNNQWGAYFSIKMNLSNIPETIDYVESTFNTIYPKNAFDYYFLDDNFNNQYKADLQFGNLFLAFSVLAILIACLGLFAMVSYSTSLRIKEIGIRKVLGASIPNLMLLISKEYLSLFIIATLLAGPVILIGGEKWLDNYAFKIDINIDLLLVPALGMLFIAILSVSYRIYKSVRANPINALRME